MYGFVVSLYILKCVVVYLKYYLLVKVVGIILGVFELVNIKGRVKLEKDNIYNYYE